MVDIAAVVGRELRTCYGLRERPAPSRNVHVAAPKRNRIARVDPLKCKRIILAPPTIKAVVPLAEKPDVVEPPVAQIVTAADPEEPQSTHVDVAAVSVPPAPVISAPPILPSEHAAHMMNADAANRVSGSPVLTLARVVSSDTIRKAKRLIGRAMGWVIDPPPLLTSPPASPVQSTEFVSLELPTSDYYLKYTPMPFPPCAVCNEKGPTVRTSLYFFYDGMVLSACVDCMSASSSAHRQHGWDVMRQCYAIIGGIDTTRAVYLKWAPELQQQ